MTTKALDAISVVLSPLSKGRGNLQFLTDVIKSFILKFKHVL